MHMKELVLHIFYFKHQHPITMMAKLIKNASTIFIMCIIFYSCKNNTSSIEIEEVIKEWAEKDILFPKGLNCISMNKDTTCISPSSTPYKILVYTDSIGCTSCKLQLYKWNKLIEEAKKEMQDLVNFQFYFHPKDIKEMLFVFRRDAFKYPSYIDFENKIDKLNKFPKNNRFHTFLLDNNNKVKLIGNPLDNNQIWNLYKQVIKGEKNICLASLKEIHPITTLEVEKPIIKLKGLLTGQTMTTKFNIKNTGNNPLIITNVSTTCGCTVPKWSKQPILPNRTTEIVVEITPSNKGFFRKTITVNSNIKKQKTILIIEGTVKNI